MDKKKALAQGSKKEKPNIIKRNIESVKTSRTRSKENVKPGYQSKARPQSQAPKPAKKEEKPNPRPLASKFESLKSPTVPSRDSPEKPKKTPVEKPSAEKAQPVEEQPEKIEAICEEVEERMGEEQGTIVEEGKGLDQEGKDEGIEGKCGEKESGTPRVKEIQTKVMPSSVKRRRDSNDLSECIEKTIKKSL
jgi:chitodextrinase